MSQTKLLYSLSWLWDNGHSLSTIGFSEPQVTADNKKKKIVGNVI